MKYSGRYDMTQDSYIPYDWVILESFFLSNKITPVWINCHYNWGRYDEELEKWTGAVGKVGEKTILSVYIIFSDRS